MGCLRLSGRLSGWYPPPPLAGWRSKFLRHRAIHAARHAEIPFAFYRDSISLLQADKDGGPGEARWKAFYRKRKIDHFEDLREPQKIRIQITADCRQMIN
jgi:hypothetical protein